MRAMENRGSGGELGWASLRKGQLTGCLEREEAMWMPAGNCRSQGDQPVQSPEAEHAWPTRAAARKSLSLMLGEAGEDRRGK